MLCVLQVADNFVSPLLDAVLLDYQRNVASAREPEVLSTMAVIVDKLDVSFMSVCLSAAYFFLSDN